MYKECVTCSRIGVSCKGPTFVAMPAAEILEWCKLRKSHLKLSNKKLAELSKIPEGTIARLLAGEHIDFKYESIRPILMILVGGTFDGNPCPESQVVDDLLQAETIAKLEAENAMLRETVSRFEHMHDEDVKQISAEAQQTIDLLNRQLRDRKVVSLILGAALAAAAVVLILM